VKPVTLLLLVWCGCACVAAQVRMSVEPITRVYKADGWDIPGIKEAHPKVGTKPHSRGESNGISYQITVLVPNHTTTAKIPFVFLDTPNRRISYEERTIRVEEIKAYEVNGHPYCYQVSAMLHSVDPKSHTGGWAGLLDMWYYDESGQGKWTVMDSVGPLLPAVPLPPKWADAQRERR